MSGTGWQLKCSVMMGPWQIDCPYIYIYIYIYMCVYMYMYMYIHIIYPYNITLC